MKVYATIRENGGWDSFKMVPIEEFECDTKLQAHIREQYWIDTLQSNMNTRGSIFNKEKKQVYQEEYHREWSIANKEHLKEYKREYGIANRERLNKKKRQKRKEAHDIKWS